MFDTSIVRTSPRKIALLTTSIAMHSAAVIAAIVLSVASTQLPPQPPRQMEIYRAFEPPAAPPPPLGKPAAARHEMTAAPRPKPAVQTAPSIVPDQTPTLSEPVATTTAPIGNDTGPIGSPIGVENSVGSDDMAISTGPATSTAPYVPGHDVTSARVLMRVEPRFPRELIHGVRSALVVVRCVIGSNGRIRDPEIITSSFPPFNEAVLVALRQWTFAPGTLRGQPVDTWFELTVRFQVR